MAEIIFSEDQALAALGGTPSASVAVSEFIGQVIEVKTGTTGLAFAGNGMLKVVLQSSLNGSNWSDFQALTAAMSVGSLPANQVLVRRRVPQLGGAMFVRLVYRISGAVPAGSISAKMVTLPYDRFKYGASGVMLADA